MTRPRRPLRTMLAVALVTGGLMALAEAQPAAATTLPSGFQEQIVFSGLNQPTNIEFAPDGRVFVAEKGGLIKVFDNLADPTPTVFADLSTNVHNQWDRGLLGLALRAGLPGQPLGLRALHLRRAARPDRAVLERQLCATPTTASCVVHRPAVPAAGHRQRDDRHRAGADPRLVPAVPQPLDRRPAVRRRRHALRHRRRRRELQRHRLRPARQPRNPCGDPPSRWRRDDPPTPRAARCARRTSAPPATRPASTARCCGSTRPPARPPPATRSSARPTPTPPDRRARPAQPVPVHHAARHQRGVGRRRRLEHVGGDRPGDQPDRPASPTSAGPATRARPDGLATTAPT